MGEKSSVKFRYFLYQKLVTATQCIVIFHYPPPFLKRGTSFHQLWPSEDWCCRMHNHYRFGERERGLETRASLRGSGGGSTQTKRKKLAPKNEIIRDLLPCQVQLCYAASGCNVNNEPLFLLQRARTRISWIQQKGPECTLHGWPFNRKRERETRFQ